MTVGNLAALRQQNVKRMLAYSSIAHAGYLLAAFAGLGNQNGSESGIAAAAFYTAAYAAMNVGIFAVITLVAGYDEQLSLIDDYRGLLYRSPLLGSLLIFFLISLIGIPFTGGFFGKFYSFSAAVGGGAICSGHHRPAQLRLGRRLLPPPRCRRCAAPARRFRPCRAAASRRSASPSAAALLLAVAATLVLGIIPGATLHAAQSAAHTLQAPPAARPGADLHAVPLQSPQ